MLLAKGADPNTITRSKVPTLYEAVRRGHFDVAALLIEAGAVMTSPTYSGQAMPIL